MAEVKIVLKLHTKLRHVTSHPVDCICNFPRSKGLNSVGEYLDQQRSCLSHLTYSLVDASELCYATDDEQWRTGNFPPEGWGGSQIQLRTEGRENGDLGVVAP
jgi:hypothetical protein